MEIIMGGFLLIMSKGRAHNFWSVHCPELSCMVTPNLTGPGNEV